MRTEPRTEVEARKLPAGAKRRGGEAAQIFSKVLAACGGDFDLEVGRRRLDVAETRRPAVTGRDRPPADADCGERDANAGRLERERSHVEVDLLKWTDLWASRGERGGAALETASLSFAALQRVQVASLPGTVGVRLDVSERTRRTTLTITLVAHRGRVLLSVVGEDRVHAGMWSRQLLSSLRRGGVAVAALGS